MTWKYFRLLRKFGATLVVAVFVYLSSLVTPLNDIHPMMMMITLSIDWWWCEWLTGKKTLFFSLGISDWCFCFSPFNNVFFFLPNDLIIYDGYLYHFFYFTMMHDEHFFSFLLNCLRKWEKIHDAGDVFFRRCWSRLDNVIFFSLITTINRCFDPNLSKIDDD